MTEADAGQQMGDVSNEYRVLGYSSSELEVNAKPLFIVLKIHGQLRGCLLQNWRDVVGCTDALGVMYIEDIVQDIRDHANDWDEDAEALFSSMSELCVGPIRTMRSGRLDGFAPNVNWDLLEAQGVVECGQEIMNDFIENPEMARAPWTE